MISTTSPTPRRTYTLTLRYADGHAITYPGCVAVELSSPYTVVEMHRPDIGRVISYASGEIIGAEMAPEAQP